MVWKNEKYWLFHNQSVDADYSFKNHLKMGWQIVRYNRDWINPQYDNVYYCEEGDIIKFGRVRFKIRKLRIQGDEPDSQIEDQNNARNPDDTLTIEEHQNL